MVSRLTTIRAVFCGINTATVSDFGIISATSLITNTETLPNGVPKVSYICEYTQHGNAHETAYAHKDPPTLVSYCPQIFQTRIYPLARPNANIILIVCTRSLIKTAIISNGSRVVHTSSTICVGIGHIGVRFFIRSAGSLIANIPAIIQACHQTRTTAFADIARVVIAGHLGIASTLRHIAAIAKTCTLKITRTVPNRNAD